MGANPGVGQAVDFSLQIGALGAPAFDAQALSIYPVPAWSADCNCKSALAHLVFNQHAPEVNSASGLGTQAGVDVAGLPAGAYFLRLSDGEASGTFKILKQ